jgi:hypothetical protein
MGGGCGGCVPDRAAPLAYKWFLLGRSVGLPGSPVDYGRFYLIGMFFNLLGISTLGGDVVRGCISAADTAPGSRSTPSCSTG